MLQRIFQADTTEQFWREVRNTGELHHLTLGKGIADLNGAVIVQAEDIARIRFFNVRTVACHKGQRVGDHYIFRGAHLAQLHAFFIFTGYHAHKRHAVAMFRVHVGLNFKYEAGKFIFARFYGTGIGLTRHRRRRPLHQAIQHMIDAEVTQRSTKEYRGDFARKEQLFVELIRRAFHQLQFVTQLLCQIFTNRSVEIRVIQPFNNADFLNGVAFTALIEIGFIFIKVVNAFKQLAAANRPGDRCAADFQLVLNFIEQFHRVADITVKFVHKGEDRRIAQTGNFHQLTGTIFYTFCGVDNHQAAVHRRQGTIGIFREVFVPRGIEQVNQAVVIRKLHHRRSDGDPTLLFHLHPVRLSVLVRATAFYCTGGLNGLSEQQHLLGDGSLTGVRVRNDCKGSSFRYLCGQKACHNCCLFDYVQSYVQRKIHAADCTFWRYQSIAEHDQ